MSADPMTLRHWFDLVATYSLWVGLYFAALPVLALLFGFIQPRDGGNEAPWKYLYSLLVYAACVPGTLAAMITLYLLLFSRENLLDVNLLVTLAPIASMGVTLAVAGRNVDFGPLPGFGRLSGLMTVLGLTFAVLFALSRTHLFLIFGGSIWVLISFAAFVFALIKWGGYMAFRRRDEPERKRPEY